VSRKVRRAEVLEALRDIALGRPNDIVRLAFADGEKELGGLDLMLLSEVKRTAGGAVEFRLADRAELFKLLLEELRLEESRTGGARSFFEAMDRASAGGAEKNG